MASEESDVDEPDEWKQNRRPRHTEKFANRRGILTFLSKTSALLNHFRSVKFVVEF